MALKDVIGQQTALAILESALKTARVASAYLFQGLSGTGKRFCAVNFAKALKCRAASGQEGGGFFEAEKTSGDARDGGIDSCDACPVCRRIEAGIHPDVVIIRPQKGVIKIDVIRQLEAALSLKSYEAGHKVAIIDEAELMRAEAANALLKTLEEPPAESLIIVISSAPERLPDTVRSRCVAVHFKPLSERDMALILKARAGEADPSKLKTIIRLSMGRPGLAADGGEGIFKAREGFLDTLGQMARGKDNSKAWADKEDISRFIDSLGALLRDILIYKVTGNDELLINRDMAPKIKTMSKHAREDVIIDCYGELHAIKGDLVYNPNKSILWNYMANMLERLDIREKA